MERIGFFTRLKNTAFFQLLQKPFMQNLLVAVIYITAVVVLLGDGVSFQATLTLDEVADRTVQAPVQKRIEDPALTEQLRQEAEDAVNKSYQEDDWAMSDALDEVNHFFRQLDVILDIEPPAVQTRPQLPEDSMTEELPLADEEGISGDMQEPEPLDEELIKQLSNLSRDKQLQEIENMFLSYHTLFGDDMKEEIEVMSLYLLDASEDELVQLENLTTYLVSVSMSKPITEEILESTRGSFMQQIVNTGLSERAEAVVSVLGAGVLRANLIYDEEATEAARLAAREAVEPVTKIVKAGEIIVREGERVTQEQIDILEQLGLQTSEYHILEYVGLFVLVILTSVIVLLLVKRYYQNIYRSRKLLYLVALIMSGTLLISRLLMVIQTDSFPELHQLTGFLAPVAACSFLVAIMIDVRLAYFINMLMTLYLGIMTGENALATMGMAFVSGGMSVYLVTRFSRTRDLAKAGLYIAGVNMVTILTFCMMDSSINLKTSLIGAGVGILNGFLSAILTIGLLPYLENAFSITSTIRLLELGDPNNPLLKRLLMEAPGTYHHSLMVGNLAEATARLVQADSVLVRVGAYYHDIGKMKSPEYFVENQKSIENPHRRIAPALSAMIITGHVKAGLQMAKQYNLPPQITDFIATHHGTSLAGYFYNLAVNEDGAENVRQDNYRYEGPRPRSKETALVMLADSCEAAVRSLAEPTRDKIQQMVHNIIKGKQNDGQLNDCDLTFRDLTIIEERFCEVLENVYHKRIAYPDAKNKR